jgi:D-glycero-alpha-D-manno-heptose-7-phosphate kinase
MIISRTPLRISFAGGGTDLKPFYEVNPGLVVGTTINKYIYVAVNEPLDESIRVSYWKTEIVDSTSQIEHDIVRKTLEYMGFKNKIDVVSVSDIPSGTGLGSSGSFTVGLLHALYAHKSLFASKEKLAKEACHVEIDLLGATIGKQDQYMCAFGGLQCIHFNPDESVFTEPIACSHIRRDELNQKLMLFYTGQARSATTILVKQFQETKTEPKFKLLNKVKGIAHEMIEVLRSDKDIRIMGELLHQEWLYKKNIVEGITNEKIDEYYDRALRAGAIGGKIAGAGGGGFMLIFCEEDKKNKVREALSDLREVNFEFESQGTTIITIS